MKVDVKLTPNELLEITCSTKIPLFGELRQLILNKQYLTEGEAYSLLAKLDRALLKLKMKQRKQ